VFIPAGHDGVKTRLWRRRELLRRLRKIVSERLKIRLRLRNCIIQAATYENFETDLKAVSAFDGNIHIKFHVERDTRALSS
jgi:hypothetical protein